MSPEPNSLKFATNKNSANTGSDNVNASGFENRPSCQLNNGVVPKSIEVKNSFTSISTVDGKYNNEVIKAPLPASRERRNVSPSSSILQEAFMDPQSPSSSSTTSQATSANDATFEPTIEMMVNDFDDEQTLNEEEALASFESQDPHEEINTLKKESEMPLEELLAKYRALPPLPPSSLYSEPLRKKSKKSLHREKHKQKHMQEVRSTQISKDEDLCNKSADTLKSLDAASGAANSLPNEEKLDDFNEKCISDTLSARKSITPSADEEQKESDDKPIIHSEIPKVRRSHLLDLYPEGTFDSVVIVNDSIAGSRKETIYGFEDDEEDEEIEDEEDEDYKKKVMIGISYQATIPIGLSQYGDILPYENEDKLIWEPSQVSEREVEEYLIKIRDIKCNQQGEEDDHSAIESNSVDQAKESCISEKNLDNLENNSFLANFDTMAVAETTPITETDSQAVVKDNEQALHLLVQCGYDFKEALRRKRLNALPLNDCMSLWSEEECHKFEEGIQKYGKDFLKIRQNQVRTRTMRELVQFYYLWKKSERRDHNFANADTVDHMDIYLNEDNEYGSNNPAVLTPVDSPVGNATNCTGSGRPNNSQKNISIMTNTSITTAAPNFNTDKTGANSCLQQHYHQQQQHKRRTHNCNQSNLNIPTTNDFCNENSSNTNSSK